MKKIQVGTFEVKSGKIRVSDPCYDKDFEKENNLDAENGEWKCKCTKIDTENRVAILEAYCTDFLDDYKKYKLSKSIVGVDSGQVGIFDFEHYQDNDIVKDVQRLNPNEIIRSEEPWYSICCDRTLTKLGAGIIPFGCVSSSGYGDGCYKLYYKKSEDNKVYAVKVIFIDDKDDE